MEELEKKSILYQYSNGLPKSTNKNNVISLIMKKSEFGGIKYINKYVTFDKNDDNTYDFPKYLSSAPEGFSIFMTEKEKVLLILTKEFVNSIISKRSLTQRQKSTDSLIQNTLNIDNALVLKMLK